MNSWAGQRVLVTGGAGFIGSHLAEALVAAGAELVMILDIAPRPEIDGTRYRNQDIMLGPWPDLSSIDVIFHFAANAYVPPSVERPIYDFETNCGATVFLLDALRQQKWGGRMVYASSAAVYGNPELVPVREDHPTVPVSPYGVGKLAAERYCAVFAQLYGLNIASLRLFSVYGPGQRKQVVWDLINKIDRAEGQPIQVHGDGTQTRDFVYVSDVVRAAMTVAKHAEGAGEVYNVGSGTECSIADLASKLGYSMSNILGTQIGAFDYTGVNRPGDPEKFVADTSKLWTLGWQPDVPITVGLRHTVEWYQQIKERERGSYGLG